MTLKDRIKDLREAYPATQTEMGLLIESGLRSWQNYEQGRNVPGGLVFEILSTLGYNAGWILTGAGPMYREDISLGELLRLRREFLEITTEGLAALIGAGPEAVESWEADRLSPPPRERAALTRILGIPPGVFDTYAERAITEPPAIYNKDTGQPITRSGTTGSTAGAAGVEFSISEDLVLAAKVLESKTHYATSLHLNIRSFASGLSDISILNEMRDVQASLVGIEEKIKELQQENRVLRSEVNRLKETYEPPSGGNRSLANASA